jgi:hypothetical protein
MIQEKLVAPKTQEQKSNRNAFLTRLVLILLLTVIASHFYIQDANQRYQTGKELTKTTYIEQYQNYRENLLDSQKYTNVITSVFTVFLGITILVSSYELIIWAISLIIKKIVRD